MHLENHSLVLSPLCACFAILQMWRKVHTCSVSAAKNCFWNTNCFISVVFGKKKTTRIDFFPFSQVDSCTQSYLRLLSLCYSFPLKLGRNNIASKNESAKTTSPKDTEIRTRKAITTSLILDSSPKLNRFCDEVFSIESFVSFMFSCSLIFELVTRIACVQNQTNRPCALHPADFPELRDSVGNECYSVSS